MLVDAEIVVNNLERNILARVARDIKRVVQILDMHAHRGSRSKIFDAPRTLLYKC